MSRFEKSLDSMYGADDLGASPLFLGNFINFGLWEGIDSLTPQTRTLASQHLYERCLAKLPLHPGDRVLEVGCGRGAGAALIQKQFSPALIVGVDRSEPQIQRATQLHSARMGSDLNFQVADAEALPFNNHFFSKLISVEAAQHFVSLDKFVEESFRVLEHGGSWVVSTFMMTSDRALPELKRLIPTIDSGIDRVFSVKYLQSLLERTGFSRIKVESIGVSVWHQWDLWVESVDDEDWGRHWKLAYDQGLLDYYVISAQRT